MFKTDKEYGDPRPGPIPGNRTSPIRYAGTRAVDFSPPSAVRRQAQKRLATGLVSG